MMVTGIILFIVYTGVAIIVGIIMNRKKEI